VRNSKILQYDTFLYTGMCGMTINYMNPFKKQSNNLEEEPGNIALNACKHRSNTHMNLYQFVIKQISLIVTLITIENIY
jgi:hypothetical protein